jgi:hypothetical protein
MRRRSLVVTGCGVAALLAASSSWGQVFKCPVGGVQVYQQSPCDGLGASGGRLIIMTNGGRAAPVEAAVEEAKPARVLGKTRVRTPTTVDGRKSP